MAQEAAPVTLDASLPQDAGRFLLDTAEGAGDVTVHEAQEWKCWPAEDAARIIEMYLKANAEIVVRFHTRADQRHGQFVFRAVPSALGHPIDAEAPCSAMDANAAAASDQHRSEHNVLVRSGELADRPVEVCRSSVRLEAAEVGQEFARDLPATRFDDAFQALWSVRDGEVNILEIGDAERRTGRTHGLIKRVAEVADSVAEDGPEASGEFGVEPDLIAIPARLRVLIGDVRPWLAFEEGADSLVEFGEVFVRPRQQ